MFKLIGLVFKGAFFAILVLVAAHYLTWDGKSVSDQVRSTLSSADRSAPVKTLHKKSKALIEDARNAVSRVGLKTGAAKRVRAGSAARAEDSPNDPAIPSEDRERLQALIHSSGDEG
jgi:hypothetical protein